MFLWGVLKVGFLGGLWGDVWWVLDFKGGGYLGIGMGGRGGGAGGLECGGGGVVGKFEKRLWLPASVARIAIFV